MDLFVGSFQIWLLIFTRMLAMFFIAPFFSNLIISSRIRVFLALIISLIITPSQIVEHPLYPYPADFNILTFGLQVAYEALIGISIGFLLTLFFTVFQMAGQVFSLQIGFGISQYFDPMQGTESSLIGQFFNLFGLLVFLSIDGHLLLIQGIYMSYSAFPIIDLYTFTSFTAAGVIQLFSDMFSISVQIGLPIMATVLLLTIAVGILARFAPQMNIFILGFPIYIMGGLITLSIVGKILIVYAGDFLLYYTRLIFGWFGVYF